MSVCVLWPGPSDKFPGPPAELLEGRTDGRTDGKTDLCVVCREGESGRDAASVSKRCDRLPSLACLSLFLVKAILESVIELKHTGGSDRQMDGQSIGWTDGRTDGRCNTVDDLPECDWITGGFWRRASLSVGRAL